MPIFIVPYVAWRSKAGAILLRIEIFQQVLDVTPPNSSVVSPFLYRSSF